MPAVVELLDSRQMLSATSIVVTTSAASIELGQAEVLTATITSSSGTPNVGTVTFFDGPTAISGAINVGSDGTASLSTSSLPSGVNTITANYSGGGSFDPSTTAVNADSPLITIAGTGAAGYSGDGGLATDATMNDTERLIVDPAGNVYFDDIGNRVVRRIDAVTHIITTYAGNGVHDVTGDGGPATEAAIDGPGGLAFDAAGNLYLADAGAECIRMVNAATGIITTVAGTNNHFGFAGDGGPATSALMEFLDYPDTGIAVDSAGNLYIDDSYNFRIRRVDAATGIITTVMGNGDLATPLTGVVGTASAMNPALELAVDKAGNLYISDGDDRIYRLDATTGILSLFAGTGTYGNSGNGGPATQANIAFPTSMVFDAAGNMYIGDSGSGYIRRIDATTHVITQVMGFPGTAIAMDSANNVYISRGAYNTIVEAISGAATVTVGKHTPTVSATDSGGVYNGTAYSASATATGAGGVSVSGSTAFIYYHGSDTAGAILSGAPTDAGTYTVVASFTSSDSSYANAVSAPVTFTISQAASSATVDSSTNASVYGTSVLLTATLSSSAGTPTSGIVDFYAGGVHLGTGTVGSNGKASVSTQLLPVGHDLVSAVYHGNVDFVGVTSAAIPIDVRQTSSSMTIGTSALTSNFGQAITLSASVTSSVMIDGGTVTFYDGNTPLANAIVVGSDGKAQFTTASLTSGLHAITASYSGTTEIAASRTTLTSSSMINTVAGNGKAGFTGNNVLATTAELNTPAGIAVDTKGNLFIADFANNVVREVDPTTHLIKTVAGGGSQAGITFAGQATDAQLNGPVSLAVDATGDLFITDANNNVIRKVVLATGAISTVAGGGSTDGDGVAATSAVLLNPQGLAVDAAGDLFIAEYGRNAVREIDATTHLITTVAGNGTHGYLGDNGAATSAELAYPTSLAIDSTGNLFIADYGNNVIREVSNGIITTVAGNHSSSSSGDNVAATSVALQGPFGVSVDAAGNLYIAETYNQSIRFVDPTTHLISTFSGNGSLGFAGDGGPANAAQLSYPTAIAIDSSGDVFIADQANNRIREVVAGFYETINPSVPTVTTSCSANMTSGSAVLGGTIASDGGATIATSGVLYALTSVNANPTLGGTGVMTAISTGTSGAFTTSVTGLLPNANYSFVAFATNSAGISYSTVGTFITLPAPTVSGLSGSQTFVKGFSPILIAPNLTIDSPNGYSLSSATVTIANWQGEDRLSFYNSYALQHTFTVNQTTNTATLTLTGTATAAAYQTTLQSLMYQDVNSNQPVQTLRTVSIVVNDGFATSAAATTSVTFQNVDLPPLISGVDSTSTTDTGNGAAVTLSSSVAVTDPDSDNLTKVTIQITSGYQHSANDQDTLSFVDQNGISGAFDASTGTLTLTGVSSLSLYRVALRSITFSTAGTSISTAPRVLTITAIDQTTQGAASTSLPVTLHITVVALPSIAGTDPKQVFVKGSPPTVIAPNLIISDSSSAQFSLATVTITNWQGEDRLSFYNSYALQHSFNVNSATNTATLTITGNASAAAYQATLRSVMFQDVNNNSPNLASRIATISITDSLSNTTTSTVEIRPRNVNLAPTLSVIETNPLVYLANTTPIAISSTILVNDPDSGRLSKLTVQISSGYQNNAGGSDLLSVVNQNGISGSFNATTGMLTLTGSSSLSNYRAAVRSVTFSTSGLSVSSANRVLTITATDDGLPTSLSSNTVTRTVLVSH